MSKNNNVIQLFFYVVICLSIGFLIYNSCKSKIVEGFDSEQQTEKQTEQSDSPQGKEFQDFVDVTTAAASGPNAIHGQYFAWDPNVGKSFDGSPLPSTLPWIKNNMDISGNLNSALIFLQDQRELLRLMGLNELGSNWSHISPVFMQYYKDKMFFLTDLEQYIQQFCMKTGAQCPGNNNSNSENWWNNMGGKGNQNWWGNISSDAQKDWDGIANNFNNMDKSNNK